MKKLLLTLGALALAAEGWAMSSSDELTDITPVYFNFITGQVDVDKMVRDDNTFGGGPNLGSDNNITNNLGEGKFFTPEGLANGYVLMGGWMKNNNKQPEFKEGFSTYDFGGNLGNVLVINGANSELSSAIQNKLGLASEPEISKAVAINGNMILFWILNNQPLLPTDPEEASPYSKLRIRFEFNAYNNDLSTEKSALTEFVYVNEQANPFGNAINLTYNDFTDSEGNWDPYKWAVIEEDFKPGNIRLGAFLKTTLNQTPANFNDGAWLIRNIEVFAVPTDYESELEQNKAYISWMQYTPAVEEEPVDLYLIGANVDGEYWASGTNPMTYADGVYTWTGDVLGSGFKINNGSWDNPEYNIGVGENGGLLTLGKAFNVVANGDTGDIRFDGFDSVNNPTVVFDMEAMTVTVTGEAVTADPEEAVLYVRGDMNGWESVDEMVQDSANPFIYTYSFDSVEEGKAIFKIADADWGTYNYGGSVMQVYSNKPGVQKLVFNADNIQIPDWVTGPMEITFNLETLELTVVGPTQPKYEEEVPPVPSIEVIKTYALEYDEVVEGNPEESVLIFDVDAVESLLNASLEELVVVSLNADNEVLDQTANNGYWYDEEGEVCFWGTEGMAFYIEYRDDNVFTIGFNGQDVDTECNIGFMKENEVVLFNVAVKLSVEEISDIEVVKTIELEYTAIPNDNYEAGECAFNVEEVLSLLGCDSLDEATVISLNEDGKVLSQTGNNGYWYNAEGQVCYWGADAAWYIEYQDGNAFVIGNYPGVESACGVSNIGFYYEGKAVMFEISVNIEKTDGIEALQSDSEASVYTLQGVKVQNPAKGGIYIIRKGNTTSKVIIR